MKTWEEKLFEEIEEAILKATPDKYGMYQSTCFPLYSVPTIMDAIREVFKEENENEND